MSPRTVERVDDWEAVPFDGGYSGLRDLASQEFSGVVTAGPTRLCMIRGTVVGVLDGSIEDFEDASATAREAPHPSLPLLALMQERSDEVRAKYYTEDTPIAEVDRTLEDGSFTGYVELSENVLSGDYYLIYHQGRSMSVAYVGAAERLITDDEAFEQADDEVGIYEVRPVAIEPIEIPEPEDDPAETGSTDVAVSPSSPGEDDVGADEAESASPDDGSRLASGSLDGDDPGASESGDDAPVSESDDGVSEPDAENASTAAPQDISEPDASADTAEPVDGTEDTGAAGSASTTPAEDDPAASEPSDGSEASSTTEPTERSTADAERSDRTTQTDGTDEIPPTASEVAESEPSETPSDETLSDDAYPGAAASSGEADQSTTDRPTTDQSGRRPTESVPSEEPHPAAPDGQSGTARTTAQTGGDRSTVTPSSGSATDLETRSIPSLDPARTAAASKAVTRRNARSRSGAAAQRSNARQSGSQPPKTEGATQGQGHSVQTADQAPTTETANQSTSDEAATPSHQQPGESAPRRSPESGESSTAQSSPDQSSPDPSTDGQRATDGASTDDGDAGDLAAELDAREQELEDLRTDLERVEAERDDLESARAELEAERDRLQAELEDARAEVERLTERLADVDDGAAGAQTQLTAAEAIDNTNLFVRYDSKGDATLETAHSGNAKREEVEENMRLEYHTQFDAADAAVGDQPFDEFLTGTIQYRFVDWVVRSLLYEVRDTGHADGMADLYNALPRIDRAELNGQVSVTYVEDGDEHRSQERFDVVVRDRMGNPLLVANINDTRDPATDAMMTDLIKRAERVGESSDSLAGAFLITESFFEPESLETAEGATSSGLFSRDKRKSFVNLSRKDGYHLCLVEARNQEFHLAVPEL